MKKMLILLAFSLMMSIVYPSEPEQIANKSAPAQQVDTMKTLESEPIVEKEVQDRSDKISIWQIVGPIATALTFILALIIFMTRKRQTRQEEEIKKQIEYKYEKDFRAELERKSEIARQEGAQKYEEEQGEASKKSEEEILRNALAEELGTIRLLGSPDIPRLPVSLLDSFVSLHISETCAVTGALMSMVWGTNSTWSAFLPRIR